MKRSRTTIVARVRTVSALLGLTVVVAACGSGQSVSTSSSGQEADAAEPQPLQKVVVALPTADFGYLPTIFAQKKGYFEEEGLDVELPVMKSNAAIPALTSGQVHFATAGSALRAGLEGAPVVGVFYTYSENTLVAVASEGIETYGDLAGKTLGTNSPGSSEDRIIQDLLAQEKIPLDQVDLIPVGHSAQRLSAIESGQVDFTVTNPDVAYTMEESGYNVLGGLGDVSPLPWSGFAVSTEALEKDAEMIKAWLRASVRAIVDIKDDPDAAVEFAISEFQLTEDVARKGLDALLKTIDADDPGGASEEALIELAESDLEAVGKQGDPAAAARKLHDFTLLREVQEELGITCRAGYQCGD